MAQVINTNSLSLITQNNINKNQSALSSSIERLSSGLRINSAKDDAAGQAIANRFTSNIKGLTQAARNANDGISLAQTTEGALSEINNNLQRVRELTVQATTGTNSDSDLSSIQDEIKSRLSEIDRVSGQTQFNGVNVLAKNGSMAIQVGANDGQTINIDLQKIDSSTLGLNGFSVSKNALSVGAAVTQIADKTTGVMTDVDLSDVAKKLNVDASTLTLHNIKGTSQYVVQSGSDSYSVSVDNGATKTGKVELNTTDVTYGDDANGIGTDKASMSGQLIKVGTDDKGTVTGYVTVQGKNYGVDAGYLANSNDSAAPTKTVAGTLEATTGIELSVGSTITKASTEFAGASTNDPLALLDKAIASVDKFRSSLGAVQNRLSSAVTNLNNTTTNLSEAQSRIQDADYATEVSNMSKAQIVQQAGNSVLSKANQVPQQVLSLLQG
ncbi:FliC/FljB family flagellin [Enterobacter hormaechei]|uniref:FliC/FljB family flagellin n=2 Tax=Enterobacter hormaechei TaxID=158836 RepID=UPI000CECC06A|nr:FliC/FljB family flagellin [Enterobacter hormaechei]EKS6314479.1 FliC/FljB family flagellin [Enterobacter hormaechei]ELC6571433.1 FliC/FljB family flagellin [Enterobacter hormaechei]EMA4504873.1 FliC/FljB family flagellin [Enterobacter hormaechei]EMF0810601.1 FliC/FljB family flagellin [Enterobacter hormaechei]MBY7159223.1 FliC/FljB family flagellin [Enterobacter hormaechei]